MSTGAWFREAVGPRYARLTTRAVVARPVLWRLLRRPLRAQFDAIATGWESRRGPEALAPLVAALERVQSATSVLDIGTGTGKAARLVAARFRSASVVGVDIAPRMIGEARGLLSPELAERVRFEVADASALPFEDRSFDLVVLLNAIPFFAELARVTAPGGVLVLVFSSGAATPIYVPPDTLPGHLGPVGFEAFEELAAGAGTAFLARRADPL